jgi:hypothetical protein
MTLPQILTSGPGAWPAPMQGGGSVTTVPGRWYQWQAKVEFEGAVPSNPKELAAAIAEGLRATGAVNIVVSDAHPFQVSYKLQAKHAATVPLGVKLRMQVAGVDASITFLAGREVDSPNKLPPNPGQVTYGTSTPRDLKVGDRGEDVRELQRRLGIAADGIFGRQTQTAVIEFQRSRGLAPNLPTETLRDRGFGAVKAATRVALYGAERV